MSSNIRRGQVPPTAQGVSEDLVDEAHTLGGFFGEWAHKFRRGNMGQPIRWSDDTLMYTGVDCGALVPTDRDDPAGAPLPLLEGEGAGVWLSQRRQAMPFAEKEIDLNQIRFYHRGTATLETELGPLECGEGDFVVIPRGIVYRETPTSDDLTVFVFATSAPVVLAEELWDAAGFASFFTDYSRMVVPEPGEHTDEEIEVETDVRVLRGGRAAGTLTYSFDPCRDVVGWIGDPIVLKMSIWDVPALGTSRGWMPPPSGAVLMGADKEFFFNSIGVPPFPNTPAPEGSYGAPSHLNDYDEVWLNHVSAFAPATDGHLWLLPRTLAHPGTKAPPFYPKNPVRPLRVMKVNFDTRVPLAWTDEARAGMFGGDPRVEHYTSFAGLDPKSLPEPFKRRLGLS